MKSFILTAALLVAGAAYAADNSANLDFGSFYAGYEVQLDGAKLTGSQYNLGNGTGTVSLEKKDGNWEGQFGFNKIISRSSNRRSETVMNYEFTVLPGGLYSATIEQKGDQTFVRMNMPYGMTANAALKVGKSLDGSNNRINISLKKEDAQKWSGFTSILYGRSFETSMTDLSASGDLSPEVLAKADPQLFVILYVLPYNYTR